MKCISCGCESHSSKFNHFIDLTSAVGHYCFVIVKDVPCYECSDCGEQFVTGEVMKQLDIISANFKNAVKAEVAVVNYADSVAG